MAHQCPGPSPWQAPLERAAGQHSWAPEELERKFLQVPNVTRPFIGGQTFARFLTWKAYF